MNQELSPGPEGAPAFLPIETDELPDASETSTGWPQPLAAASTESVLLQIQNRLLHLTMQIEHIQGQVEHLIAETEQSGEQIDVVTRQLITEPVTNVIHEQLAQLATQLVDQQDQLIALQQTASNAASQEQVEQLTQALAQTAHQAQLEQLSQLVADRAQLANLEETLKKLTRTQFRANTLGETKEQQVASALATLQEILNRREQRQESQVLRNTQQLATVRGEARSQMAAELLPALDSLELALENGAALLARQHEQLATVTAAQNAYLAALVQPPSQAQSPGSSGSFWARLWGKSTSTPAPDASALPDLPEETVETAFRTISDAMTAWLQGLALVRDRFVSLLAGEGIQTIDALHQPFDPRLHVAVEVETRSDVPPDTVVRVLRKGYRQRDRVLRYAEVVAARETDHTTP
jgi:molecular chaperone GrpE (heat shock protein)